MRNEVFALACIALSGCSTAAVLPDIVTFGAATETAAARSDAAFAAAGVDAKLAEERRAALVAQGGFLKIDGCEVRDPFGLEGFDDPAVGAFATSCRLDPVRIEAGAPVSATISLPQSAAVKADDARRAVRALRSYAAALRDLAASNAPADVATAGGRAISAVGKLAQATADTNAAPLGRVIDTGSGLVAALVRESLEARRYRLLKSVVTTAHPAVTNLAQTVGRWFYGEGSAALRADYIALNALSDAAIKGGAAEQKALQDAYDALKLKEDAQDWRLFQQIAVTHKAILDSLEKPAGIEELAAANDRIRTLATAAEAFLAAVKSLN